ncbi:phytoene/squalene synthase family protein [Pantoea sp. Aalb]|uniref:phytoene/squalene synthase family protein n=1 Tax=Pantoea sp. Aalb TaxID=2576762 RepID=UPI0013269DB3|nr:phytoene/squalene synthase family protein [Pantoea sp. Aalb]MXP67987.1 phytoene/squalene synthase family protein [Pantoea sp. Aalb]
MNINLLQYIEKIIKNGSKSFFIATKLLDSSTRRSTLLLYTWCRYCDDLIDGQNLGIYGTQKSIDDLKARILHLKIETSRAYDGAYMNEPAFKAFQEVIFKHSLPSKLAFDHLEGFAMDVRNENYYTFNDTLRYCYHVAGIVGLMMAHVMGIKEESVLDRACDLGLAFQLTNIARDIIEDAQNGRCYLPQLWLDNVGLSRSLLCDPKYRAALVPLVTKLISKTNYYYYSAYYGLQNLSVRSAWAIATAYNVYHRIGLKIKASGIHAWDTRQYTSNSEKLILLLKGAVMAITSGFINPQKRPCSLWQRPR